VCPDPRREFFRYMDAANVDLKAFTERFYAKVCSGRLATVLDTLLYLAHETSVWLETTTLLIPGENDSDREISEMSAWVVENLGADTPMHFTAFHPDYRMLDRPQTPAATLHRARSIAMDNGVRYAYTGNIRDATGSATWCHGCGALLIGRNGYQIGQWQLDEQARCRACQTPAAGVFESHPGSWGARRLPVRVTPHRANA
ncbi:MAG: AmmeMemoRadiSam system radical SAM enzyme, partial [Chromatiales bacterium]|nr:AmmeMemoRadiSam system radical SAM enzyme [Chromatiales bacterium]